MDLGIKLDFLRPYLQWLLGRLDCLWISQNHEKDWRSELKLLLRTDSLKLHFSGIWEQKEILQLIFWKIACWYKAGSHCKAKSVIRSKTGCLQILKNGWGPNSVLCSWSIHFSHLSNQTRGWIFGMISDNKIMKSCFASIYAPNFSCNSLWIHVSNDKSISGFALGKGRVRVCKYGCTQMPCNLRWSNTVIITVKKCRELRPAQRIIITTENIEAWKPPMYYSSWYMQIGFWQIWWV